MLNPKLDHLQDYPFARLAKLIAGVQPPPDRAPVIMSIGEPQMNPPAFVPEILQREAAGWGRYPTAGTPDLRQAIAGWLTRRYGLPENLVDADRHLVPVAGTREALFQAALVCVPAEKGGGQPVVLAPNPFYQVYIGAGVMSGAQTMLLKADESTGFLPDLDAIDAQTWVRTALVYLCSPANPQGAVADLPYLTRALDLCRRHDAVLALDECYAEIYRDRPPAGGMQAAQALDRPGDEPFANLLVFHSLSKRSSAPGLRSGFVAGDARLIEGIARLRSYGGASVPQPIMAASAALWRDDAHVEAVRARYNACFDAAAQILHNRMGFFRPEGGFFLWLDVGDGEAAARRLWAEAGIKVLPGLYLSRDDGAYNPGRRYIRVALVHDVDTTRDALQRMAQVL